MSYLGNSPPSQNFVAGADQFSGTGSQTAFTLSRVVNTVFDIFVTVSNVPQDPFTAYTISGNTLTFDSAPPSGTNNIDVVYRATNVQTFVPSPGVSQQFAIGTAASPAITFVGDTNTGIYSPAADTIAFAEGGAEVARFDSSGNFGLGTSSPLTRLDVNGVITTRAAGGGEGGQLSLLNPDNADNGLIVDVSTADVGRIFSVRNNSTLMLGQLGGTGGIVSFYTAATEQARITAAGLFQFNSGYGSVATAYGCRAWVNFNGTGTVAIRASGNVSSITDNNTGDYTVNFTTAMPDANYSAVCMQNNYLYTASTRTIIIGSGAQTDQATSSFRLYSGTLSNGTSNGSAADSEVIRVAIFR